MEDDRAASLVPDDAAGPREPRDQAQLPIFRFLLFMQLAVAGFFGLGPFVAPEATAVALGYPGDEHLIYHIAGAATLGYAVAAAAGLRSPT